jgi:hypothetical protein
MVLNAEPFEWMVRIASHNIVVKEEEKAASKANKKTR